MLTILYNIASSCHYQLSIFTPTEFAQHLFIYFQSLTKEVTENKQ